MVYEFITNSKKTEKVFKYLLNKRNFLKLFILASVVFFCVACNSKGDRINNVYPFITSSEPIRYSQCKRW